MGQQGDAVQRNFYQPLMGVRPNRNQNQSINKQQDLYNMYYNTLSELCMNRFKWTGLPTTVDVRFMERTLFLSGLSVFYFEERYDQFLAMRATSAGAWNMYDNPTGFQISGNSFINRYIAAAECVPIWANYSRRPDTDIVGIYATKLADLDMSLEINAQNIRRTKVAFTTENQKLSTANIVRQIEQGDPVVYLNKKIHEDKLDVQVHDMGVDPDQLLNAHMFKSRLWSECMGLLGIDNANQDKKERLVASEVSANDGQTDNMRRVNLNAREQAADAINRRWPGLPEEVKVSYHVDDTPLSEPRQAGELSSTTERSITR